jgi:hypothetical protein
VLQGCSGTHPVGEDEIIFVIGRQYFIQICISPKRSTMVLEELPFYGGLLTSELNQIQIQKKALEGLREACAGSPVRVRSLRHE